MLKQLHHVMKIILVLVLISVFCTSCWSAVTIEQQIYVSAIGMEYEEEEENYKIYAQAQNFKSIIEFTTREKERSSGTFVGIGTGKTINEAALSLARSSQAKIDWGHLEAIVLSEEVIKKDGITIPRKIYRFPETRYNSWFYVTNESIFKLFTTGNIYDETSLSTVLFDPSSSYRQKSTVKPLLTFDLVANINEPDRTVAVPYLSYNKDQWKNSSTNLELLEINGAYFVSLHGNQKLFDLEEVKGFRILQIPSRNRLTLMEEEDSNDSSSNAVLADIILIPYKKDIVVNTTGMDPKFEINISFNGAMYELNEAITYNEMIEKLKKHIVSLVQESYLIGVENEIDMFNLMSKLRRKNPQLWKKLTDDGKTFILTEESLEAVNVHVRIPFNGKYKFLPEVVN